MKNYICRECGGNLCKSEVVNVDTNEYKGHLWICYDCDIRYVGFGDSNEYDGTTKVRPDNLE